MSARASAERTAERPPGVNVIGYFRSENGIGEAVRQVVRGLDSVALPLVPVHAPVDPSDGQGHPFSSAGLDDADYPINLICMDAARLSELPLPVGHPFFAGRHSIGLWAWTGSASPPEGWSDAVAALDEVWAPSDHTARALAAVVPLPVTQVPLPVEVSPTAPLPRFTLGLPDGDFVFLASFDYHAGFVRKNPVAVVEAFRAAFEPASGTTLVIKTINADSDPVNRAKLQAAAEGRSDVRLIEDCLPAEANDGLTAACDCFVSLHRVESFGLAMAGAMYLGKPVIATGYSGNREFMTPENSYLVDYELVPIEPEGPRYVPCREWAQPNVRHAAALMRDVYDNRSEADARGRRASADIRAHHSPAVVGAEMLARIEIVHGAVAAPSAQPLAGSGVGAASRRAVGRLTRPVTSPLRERFERLERRQTRSVADRLREARMDAARLRSLRTAIVERLDDCRPAIVERLDDLSRRTAVIEAEAHAIPFMQGSPFVKLEDPEAGVVLGYTAAQSTEAGDGYRGFEDVFRGSEDFIRGRQRRYLPVIGQRQPVLDLGCGRGELLDLLREAGLTYTGVDTEPGMVARCREKGHRDVVLADGLDYLEQLPDGALGVLFAAQVIEHLSVERLRRLFALAKVKLAGDGRFIAETVNPHSPPALKAFWVDLTHRLPIFPEVALELCREAGLASAYIFHPNGSGDVERDRFTQGEYAVVATPGGELAH